MKLTRIIQHPLSAIATWGLELSFFVIKTRQLLSKRESQSAMIIYRMCARRFFQFPVTVYKQQEMKIDTALSEIESKYDFTFKEKQLTAIKSIIANKKKIPLTYVCKHFLSSSFF